MTNGACISSDGLHRYSLWRYWDASRPVVIWVMLNPSTADALTDDPTIKKCIKFSKTWGYGGMIVLNLFTFRATDPRELRKHGFDVLIDNGYADEIIGTTVSENEGALVVCAWGQNGGIWDRASAVEKLLIRFRSPLYAIKLTKAGMPCHPLYLRDDSKPLTYAMAQSELSRECCLNIGRGHYQACGKRASHWYDHDNMGICSYCDTHVYQCGQKVKGV